MAALEVPGAASALPRLKLWQRDLCATGLPWWSPASEKNGTEVELGVFAAWQFPAAFDDDDGDIKSLSSARALGWSETTRSVSSKHEKYYCQKKVNFQLNEVYR